MKEQVEECRAIGSLLMDTIDQLEQKNAEQADTLDKAAGKIKELEQRLAEVTSERDAWGVTHQKDSERIAELEEEVKVAYQAGKSDQAKLELAGRESFLNDLATKEGK